MPFRIIRDDLTHVRADAIVNTANPEPVIGSGTDSAVYKAAGAEALLADRKKIGPIHPGEVAATGAHGLHARYILHTVGPDWRGAAGSGPAMDRAAELLASCYRKSLLLAEQLGCASIAFPLISAGNYGYPREQALQIALDTIRTFLQGADMDVTLVVYDRNSYALSATLTDHVDAYIDERYVEASRESARRDRQRFPLFRRRREKREEELFQAHHAAEPVGGIPHEAVYDAEEYREEEPYEEEYPAADYAGEASSEDLSAGGSAQNAHFSAPTAPPPAAPKASESIAAFKTPAVSGPPAASKKPAVSGSPAASGSLAVSGSAGPASKARRLKDLLDRKSETFQEQLLRLIDEKGYTDVEVYKRANVDRKLFSKIRSNPDYHPQKRTAVALAMALRLNMDETTDLLRLAGIALSPASLMDVIVGYCIENRIYDLFEVNALLFDYDQPLLG